MLKGGTRLHAFGSLQLQPWGRRRKKQGWTEADGRIHTFLPGCGYTHCFSSSHPCRAAPQGWMQRSTTTESLQCHPCCTENPSLCSFLAALPTSLSLPHPESTQKLQSRMRSGPLKARRNSHHEKGDRESRFLPMQENCCRRDE